MWSIWNDYAAVAHGTSNSTDEVAPAADVPIAAQNMSRHHLFR
jgi:hypothetical protein